MFDLLKRDDLTKADRDRIKQASRELLAGVLQVIAPLDRWTEKEQTQAEVETFILDRVYQQLSQNIGGHLWQFHYSPRMTVEIDPLGARTSSERC